MGLNQRALARLAELGIETPTPIQAQAIPPALAGRDVLGLAETGTGKTAAYALPLIQALEAMPDRALPKTARSLILAPTRELANQISEAIADLAVGARLKTTVVFGGASIQAQRKRLSRGTDILVATPGRLMDLLDRQAVFLDRAAFLALDEADQMLDMGFIHALRQIAPLLPATRQTLLFSATMPRQMAELASAFLTDPVRVEVSRSGAAAVNVEQSIHFVRQGDKIGLLRDALSAHPGERALVFSRTKHGADRIAERLARDGFDVDAIHGDKRQRERLRTLEAFRAGQVQVLVATDVAARGLDIPEVRYVYNYDLPNVAESYVHRIGRTARAGASGNAVAFCAEHEADDLRAIERMLGESIPVASGAPWRGRSQPKRTTRPPRRPEGRRPRPRRAA